jgi:hypothetical protein|tara:strand:- start:15 stop:1058 length:1044 start_codon:yes stop_codon:yes gene_type:complete
MEDNEKIEETIFQGVRFANIYASTVYPLVSAWEFEFLKAENIIRERWDNCTIYMMVQRPLTYFDKVVIEDSYIHFEITDGMKPPLPCRINLVANGLCEVGEVVDISVEFYSKTPGNEQPLRNVGALRIFRSDGTLVVWWSPQKILYEMIVNNLEVEIAEGSELFAFSDYKVHYIGKSFSQKVWNRLTGHEKMQRILTIEREVGTSPEARAPFEISLIFLNLLGLDDAPMVGSFDGTPIDGAKPIIHTLDLDDEEALGDFMTNSPVKLGDEALTREVEAMLIHQFRPEYNEIKFDNYPEIKGGMRSKGYTNTHLRLERLPAFLFTDHFSMVPVVDGEAISENDAAEPE